MVLNSRVMLSSNVFSGMWGGYSGPGMKMHGKMKEFGPQIGIIQIILCPLDLPMVFVYS